MDSENNIFQDVSSKSDIYKVVGTILGFNNLIKKGKAYFAICPFHNDTHPSMRVDIEKNMFKCFSCGVGGSSIKFVQEYEHLNPIDALKRVCQICDIPIPDSLIKKSNSYNNKETQFKKEIECLNEANKYYMLSLLSKDGENARNYLKERHIERDIIEQFNIGYAPIDNKKIVNILTDSTHKFTIKDLENSGIVNQSNSEIEDRIKDRITFPIFDNNGYLSGFSARYFQGEQIGGKYINYPDTPLFRKNEILYNFNNAKIEAKKCGYIYIVEGFMDVIAFYKIGYKSCCATMGTALTEKNINNLKNLNCEVRLCFDSDEPGQIANEKGCNLLEKYGVPFKIVRKFKGCKDADELVNKDNGIANLKESVNNMLDPFLFMLARTLKGRQTITDPKEINDFIKTNIKYFNLLDPITKENDTNVLMKIFKLSNETINKLISDYDKNSSDKNEGQTIQKKYDYSNYKKRKPQYVDLQLKENHLNYLKEFKQLYTNDLLENDIIKILYDNECDIVSNLAISSQAAKLFQLNDLAFINDDLFSLSNLICDVYISDGSKLSLSFDDYQSIKDKLKCKDEDENFLYSEKEREIIEQSLNYLSNITIDAYSRTDFEKLMNLHSLYYQLYALYLKYGKNFNTEPSVIDTTLKIETKIRQFGGKINIIYK